MLVDVLELGLVEGGGLVLSSCSSEFAPLRLIGQFVFPLHSQVIPGIPGIPGGRTSKRTAALGHAL